MAVKLEGPLTKWTNVVQGWQYRWFVLDEHTGLLSYYTSKDKMMKGARRGCLRLKGAKIGISDEDDSTFTITCDHRTFHFQARDGPERTKWVRNLEEVTEKYANANSPTSAIPTDEELNQRMKEAETYFRILTQQVKKLEIHISNAGNTKTERTLMLQDSLTQMVETMGQTIELLNSAKSALTRKVPVPVINGRSVLSLNDAVTKENSGGVKSAENSPLLVIRSKNSPEPENSNEQLVGDTNAAPLLLATVPIDTYTLSSDEEDADDEFFDAQDEFNLSVSAIEKSLELKENTEIDHHKEEIIDMNFGVSPTAVAEKTPAKAITVSKKGHYETDECEEDQPSDDDENSNDNLQAHGSVITHLISQVKIGMDLTKVTLPTFILERRSLLEMYADFFAHPELFKQIPDIMDPGQRMIQVLKWYLSSFHAGRKGSVAKKPYNPILGEIFQCFYNIPDDIKRDEKLAVKGPIPWATKDDVTFLSEQVSHHPPISAFYAECENKRICFNSQIWTKSKFLGLSIGVHMFGTGNVFVSDHNEEYIMTFPNAYGRSILTVPWVELGGRTEITCAKTGYSSQIELHTKPFYGGKRNRITAEVFAPNEKRPIMSVHGEWNGVMYAKTPNDKDPVPFVDTFKMPVKRKIVKRTDRQEEFESRRMWKSVTQALKINDIENATAGKHYLEERQRSDARIRKETNSKWVTRMFDETGEGEDRKWFYKWPLYQRNGKTKPGDTS